MKCYKCRTEIKENTQFCPNCGAAQQMTQELIHRAIHKDAAAVEQLFYMTREEIYFTVRTMVWDEEAAFALVQEIYVKAFKALANLKNPAGFSRWLKRMAYKTTVEHLRKTQPKVFEVFAATKEETGAFTDDREILLPESVLSLEQVEEQLGELLVTLPAQQRILAGMYYGQQVSVNEISEILEVPVCGIKTALLQAAAGIGESVARQQGMQTNGLTATGYLMWLYQGLKMHSAECASDVILHGIQKKTTDKKGAKAAKAVGVAAMAVAGESVGEVAKEGLKATITKIIAGLTATAVIGGGTGVAVRNYNENKEQELQPGAAVSQEVQTSQADSAVSESTGTDTDSLDEVCSFLNEKYQETLENALYISIKDGGSDLSIPKGYIDSMTDAVLGAEGYLAKELGASQNTGNILWVPCYITLNDVWGTDADGSVNYTTYEDLAGLLKISGFSMEEDGAVTYEDYVEFVGFYIKEEELAEEWIEPLESRYRIETVRLE